MKVSKGKAIEDVCILDKLFLIGDLIYYTGSIHVMNGEFAYATKIFDGNKKYLGMIRSDDFPLNAFKKL